MKNTKSKLAAATFGAALTTLYAAPELSAQIVDTNPTSTPLTFTTSGGMPFDGVVPFAGAGTTIAPEDLIQVQGNSAAFSSGAIGFTFFNASFYGFGVDIQFLSQLFVLEPCSLFDGVSAGPPGFESEDPRILPFDPGFGASNIFGTGVNTFGFVANGEIGYFRVDLGSVMGSSVFGESVPLDDAIILDGATSVPTDGGENDFVVKTPGDDMGPVVLLGDVNEDGMVTFGDLAPLFDLIFNPDAPFNAVNADVNEDGMITFGDIAPLFDIIFGVTSMSDSNGETVDLAAVGNEDLARRVKQQLTEEITAAVAARQNSSSDQTGHASVGLAALAMGAVGLRRRRKAATTAA